MAFAGWLLKVDGNTFPNRLIALSSYKITPNQRQDLDPYRDLTGRLHRNVLEHKVTKIEFSTPHLFESDVTLLDSFFAEKDECKLDYWNPRRSVYETGTFYVTDIDYDIYMIKKKTTILYKPIKISMTEY